MIEIHTLTASPTFPSDLAYSTPSITNCKHNTYLAVSAAHMYASHPHGGLFGETLGYFGLLWETYEHNLPQEGSSNQREALCASHHIFCLPSPGLSSCVQLVYNFEVTWTTVTDTLTATRYHLQQAFELPLPTSVNLPCDKQFMLWCKHTTIANEANALVQNVGKTFNVKFSNLK